MRIKQILPTHGLCNLSVKIPGFWDSLKRFLSLPIVNWEGLGTWLGHLISPFLALPSSSRYEPSCEPSGFPFLRMVYSYLLTLLQAYPLDPVPWQRWRRDQGAANLSNLKFQGLVLPDIDLSDLHLVGSGWWGTDLRGANLQRGNLMGADLRSVNLKGADLRWANLIGANLRGANLTGADLTQAQLQRCNLSEVQGVEALFQEANLHGANLSEGNWVNASFYKADLTETIARQGVFSAVEAYGSQWCQADLSYSDFRWAHLRQANFHGAILTATQGLDKNR